MYKSPIEILAHNPIVEIIEKQNKQQDEHIYECIIETGVNVDKEELIKALKYDREQYHKGYTDGINDLVKRLKENLKYFWEEKESFVSEEDIDNVVAEMTNNKQPSMPDDYSFEIGV